jgi:hypothetical protein
MPSRPTRATPTLSVVPLEFISVMAGVVVLIKLGAALNDAHRR